MCGFVSQVFPSFSIVLSSTVDGKKKNSPKQTQKTDGHCSFCHGLTHLQSLEDLASSFVAGRGDEGLEDVAARGVRSQRQQVSGGQRAQAAEEQRALLESGQRLHQPGAVVTDGGQRYLEMTRNTRAPPHCGDIFSTSRCWQVEYVIGNEETKKKKKKSNYK